MLKLALIRKFRQFNEIMLKQIAGTDTKLVNVLWSTKLEHSWLSFLKDRKLRYKVTSYCVGSNKSVNTDVKHGCILPDKHVIFLQHLLNRDTERTHSLASLPNFKLLTSLSGEEKKWNTASRLIFVYLKIVSICNRILCYFISMVLKDLVALWT